MTKINKPLQLKESYSYTSNKPGVESVTKSAEIIVPLIMRQFSPSSVLDVGCGVGDFLAVFRKNGVKDVSGFDGPWVPKEGLLINEDEFESVDFYLDVCNFPRTDIAICLEVFEHLDDIICRKLLGSICDSSDVVVFSAAIPEQGGWKHINERYQSYWSELFGEKGFDGYDLIRPSIWGNSSVSYWYQQNLVVYANKDASRRYGLKKQPYISDLIHPTLYDRKCDPRRYSLSKIFQNIPYYFTRTLSSRMRKRQ